MMSAISLRDPLAYINKLDHLSISSEITMHRIGLVCVECHTIEDMYDYSNTRGVHL